MNRTICKDFNRKFLNWEKHKKKIFQRWRSFQFDKATDTTDTHVLRLKQCVQMLRYNKGQVLTTFQKNTLTARYYYLLFGIQNLRDAVENDQCVMTKDKLDKQLAC